MSELVALAGTVVNPESLGSLMALELIRHLGQRQDGAFSFIEARSFDNFEGVVVDVMPELPQRRVYDFHSPERLIILFWPTQGTLPDVFALRRNFPRVPHMNLFKRADMRWICLFGEDPDEVRQRLTAHVLAERILWWFAENAAGTLHREDQALEPFLAGDTRPVYFSATVFDVTEKSILAVYGALIGTPDEVLVVDEEKSIPTELRGCSASLIPIDLPVQTHGVIYEEPETLTELSELCQVSGFDLMTPLVETLKDSCLTTENSQATILLLRIPKGRNAGEAEVVEYRAFRMKISQGGQTIDGSPAQIAVALGLAEMFNGKPTLVLRQISQLNQGHIHVSMLAPKPLSDRREAALLNGESGPVDLSIFAVGMGALGSQVFAHLIRKGFGRWTVVDGDTLEPHNLARHEVFDRRFGFKKAIEMAVRANSLFAGEPVATPIVANLNRPGDKTEKAQAAAASAEVILDMSASTAVARELVHGIKSRAQRISLFLSPSGHDLVVMAEGTTRRLTLDELEAQYLRAVINNGELNSLLDKPGGRLRIGPGCRDRSSRIPNELVSLHAAIGSKAVMSLAQAKDPSILIWRCRPETMEVQRVEIATEPASTISLDGWSLTFDDGLRDKLQALRSARLPKETCGVLIGQFDALRQRLYVFDALPAPVDSEEEPDGCQRGIEALKEAVDSIRETCGGDADYVGEWHSHPDRASCLPSNRDLAQMLWIEEKMHPAGLPALMIIACQAGRNTILFGRPGSARVQHDPS